MTSTSRQYMMMRSSRHTPTVTLMPSRIPEKNEPQKRVSAKQAAKSANAAPVSRTAAGKTASVNRGGISGPSQPSMFEKAMEHFHARNFAEALQLFEAAACGPSPGIAHAARLHLRMCEQRLGQPANLPISADDHYNLAVALINRRELPEARVHLEVALKMTPQGDHLHYAMSLLSGLEGDYAASARSLGHAIELEARNRSAARNDPDFREILRHAELRAVLESQGDPAA
jgi:tetratricopeptide (TPR) repeat protein